MVEHPENSLIVRGRNVGVDIAAYDSDAKFEADVVAAEQAQGVVPASPLKTASNPPDADIHGPLAGSGNADGVNSTEGSDAPVDEKTDKGTKASSKPSSDGSGVNTSQDV